MTTLKTPKAQQAPIEHKDRLGRVLKLGDCVVYPSHNSLSVGTVKKLNPKMVKVVPVGNRYRSSSGSNKYPQDIVVVDGPEVTMYLLRANTTA
jgi:hypothetical protein